VASIDGRPVSKQRSGIVHTLRDADVLRDAARVLRQRSKKPDGVGMRILQRVLIDTARDIEAEVRP
jgi:hypothetical protein